MVAPEGRPGVTKPVKNSTNDGKCCFCTKTYIKGIDCEKCKSTPYCSKFCREKHFSSHKKICGAIQELQAIENSKKIVFSVREPGQMKVQNRLIQLIGEKPILKCSLNDVECEALWDTGSMVSLINFDWFEERFPAKPIQSVHEFLEGDNLHLCAANNTNLEVEGVAILEFSIEKNFNVPVPFLITKNKLNQPIIGYNVIEHVVLSEKKGGGGNNKMQSPLST